MNSYYLVFLRRKQDEGHVPFQMEQFDGIEWNNFPSLDGINREMIGRRLKNSWCVRRENY